MKYAVRWLAALRRNGLSDPLQLGNDCASGPGPRDSAGSLMCCFGAGLWHGNRNHLQPRESARKDSSRVRERSRALGR